MDTIQIIRFSLLALSIFTCVPVIYQNYQGIRVLPGQIGFWLLLYLPNILYFVISFFIQSISLIVIPQLFVLIVTIYTIHDISHSKGSTSALGYLAIPVISTVLFIVVGGITWTVLKFL